MKNLSYKIKTDWLMVFLLFFSMFKISYIPGYLRQSIKIISLLLIFLFLIKKIPKGKLINISIVFPICIVFSGIVAYIQNVNTLKSLLESSLYSLMFYDAYTLIYYFKFKKKYKKLLFYLYNISKFFVIVNILTIFVFGNNRNVEPIYLLGNKFSSAYMMILLISLYGATHNMDYKVEKMKYNMLIIISALLCIYMYSITPLVSLIFVFFASLYKKRLLKILLKPKLLIFCMLISTSLIFVFDSLLKVSFINNLIFNVFGKSISIFGRQVIYDVYIMQIINKGRIWLGSGYNNDIIFSLSNGVFGNAQNGLMEHFISFGLVGILSIVITVYYCLKKNNNNDDIFYLVMTTYSMVIAATVEVTINWFFFLSLFLIANYKKE